RLAQRGAQAGVWDWDLVGGETFWSDEFYALLGIDRTVTPSVEHMLDVMDQEDRPSLQAAIDRALQDRSPIDAEFSRQHPDKGWRWISFLGQTTVSDSGHALRMSGIILDITDRKQLEEELHDRVEQLAEADHRKDQFLATLAHELRNPLAPISNV